MEKYPIVLDGLGLELPHYSLFFFLRIEGSS